MSENPFHDEFINELANETIAIVLPDGKRHEGIRVTADGGKFTIYKPKFEVPAKSVIERSLPYGVERWEVGDSEFEPAFHDLPDQLKLIAHKHGSSRAQPTKSITNNLTFHAPASGFNVGDHGIVNIEVTLRDVLTKIENSTANPEQKKQAKALWARALEHPVTVGVLGAAATAAFSAMVGGAE